MKIEISDIKKCDIFVNIFANMKNFNDSIQITCNEEKFYIQGMDNSHVCVFELFLDKDWFDVYECSGSQNFGIHLPIFEKMLSIRSDKQKIVIYDEDSDNLEIELTSDEKGSFDKYFTLPLIDIDSELFSIPESEYDVDITMNCKKFKTLIDELSNFDEILNIKCQEEAFNLESESTEGSMKVNISMDDIELYQIVENSEIKSSFSIKYIVHMSQFHKLCPDINIHLSPEMPIQLCYNITEDESSKMKFYLAPKIDG